MTEQPNPYSQPESSGRPIGKAKKPTSKRKILYWIAMGVIWTLALIGLVPVVFTVWLFLYGHKYY